MNNPSSEPLYNRAVLKISGAALKDAANPISPSIINRLAGDIKAVVKQGVQLAIVPGAGNYFRGAQLAEIGLSRVTGDHMGMVATVLNALALRDVFEANDIKTRIMSALSLNNMVEAYERRKAMRHLQNGQVVIIPGGTSNPLVTTDSAASLRSLELEADALLKATNVDGVYSKDPSRYPDAHLYKALTYKEVLDKELAVMDLAAFCQCRDYAMELRVFNIDKPSGLQQVITNHNEGTTIR